MAESFPALAHRVTVLGFTRNIAATSLGVSRTSGASGASWVIVWSLGLGAPAATLWARMSVSSHKV